MAKGTSVDLIVAASGGASVPDVTGSDSSTARSKLESLGFNVSTAEVESTQPAGIVVDQDPGGGTQVPSGGTVTIYISSGSSGGGSSGGGSSGGGSAGGGGSQPPAPSRGGGSPGGGSSGGGSQPPAPG